MRLSSQRFKFLGISILALLIFVPILVFAFGEINTPAGGYRAIGRGAISIPSFHYADNSLSSIDPLGTCIQNTSGNDYFVPTRTINEWNAFFSHQPSGITLTTCCGDGACNGGETCAAGSCPADCGACATCTGFYYTDWSQCDGSTQTRAVITGSPAGCVGGSPVTSQSCSCSAQGCSSGTCRNGTIYLNSSYCTGGSTPAYNVCIPSYTPNYSCVTPGGNISQVYTPSSGCTYAISCMSHGSGCTSGNTCRDTKVYLDNAVCGGTKYGGGIQYNCMATSVPDGCNVYSSDVSVTYTTVADGNCSH